MKRTSLRPALCALAIVSAFASCSVVFQKPEVEFRGVVVDSFDARGAMLQAAFDVNNPNTYKLSIEKLSYRIRIQGFEAGHGEETSRTVLPGKTVTAVRLPLSVDWSRVKTVAWAMLYGRPVPYEVEGEITFTTPAGTFTRPYKHAGSYAPFSSQPPPAPGRP